MPTRPLSLDHRCGWLKICGYDNNQSANEKYGALFNWYAVNDSRGLCPEGWHVPTRTEWTTLTTFLGGSGVAGGRMKVISDLWSSPNADATNVSCFSGFPGGNRYSNGTYVSIGDCGYWWSSVEYLSANAWLRSLLYYNGHFGEGTNMKRSGFSVRCLRD